MSFSSMTLKNTPRGLTVTVSQILGACAIKRRIMDMGITKGTKISIRKISPLGDPIEVTVRGYEITLRKETAAHIIVQ